MGYGFAATVRAGLSDRALVSRWVGMLAGTFVLAAGVALLILSGVGTGPIDALVYGLTERVGVNIGVMSLLVSVVFIAAAWLAGIRPGVGTVISMVAFAPLLAFMLEVAPHGVGDLPFGWAAMEWLAGAVLIAVGSSFMIAARLGVGAYDAATLAVARRTGWSVPWSRLALDVGVAVVALLFGGPIWLGTVALAVVMPPLLAVFLPVARRAMRADTRVPMSG